VSYAIEIVDLVLDHYGPPVWVRHEIVHNRHVCDRLRARGAIFVDDLTLVPRGSLLIFSAHGVAPTVRADAEARQLRVIDATCPLVTKVHLEALRFAREDYRILLIGHRGHVEVEGTLGHAPERMLLVETVADVEALELPEGERIAVVTQTTLSVDDTHEVIEAIQRRFDDLDYLHDLGDIELNISGCMNACGHHHVGHIGVLGVDKKGAEFYQLMLGGSQGNQASLATILGPSFASDDVPSVIATILDIYVARRGEGETFIEFVRRVGVEPFREVVYAKPAHG
jgi:hypothetical protein